MRIIHSSDWQIGLKANHVAQCAHAVREARLQASRNVIDAANRAQVDAVVLAGDLFEDNLVSDQLVRRVVEILATSRAPVYVLPGNHDPLTEDSVFRRASWRLRPDHLILLENNLPVPISGTDAVLIPAPVFQKKSFVDPTLSMAAPEAGKIAIGVAHGSLSIAGKHADDDFPIALDAVQRLKLDYLALGHWHAKYQQDRVAYCGTHEPTRFGENRAGQALLVQISAPGAMPIIEEISTRVLTWTTLELDLGVGTKQAMAQARNLGAQLSQPQQTLLRLQTSGTGDDDFDEQLVALQQELAAQLLYLTVERGHTLASQAQGHLASVAATSPLVAALWEDLARLGSEPQVAPEELLEARRVLNQLTLEIWP